MTQDSGSRVVDLTARRSRMLGPLQVVRRLIRDEPDRVPAGTPRAVLVVLASYADADDFTVRVGRILLARETGFSRSTLRRAIRALEAAELIEVLVEGDGDKATTYLLANPQAVCEPVDNPTVLDQEGVHSEPGGGSPRTRGGVHSEPLPVVTDSYREEGARRDRCRAHALVENPPPCRACRDSRLAADAADEDEAKARRHEEARRRVEDQLARRNAPKPPRASPETIAAARRAARPPRPNPS